MFEPKIRNRQTDLLMKAVILLHDEEDAYRLARHQLGNTDLDIISSAVGIQNICIVYVLNTGYGKMGLTQLFDTINGHNSQNEALAELTYEQALNLPFMKNK